MTAAPRQGGWELGVASWNVHGCVGIDGRWHPERVATVLRELGADLIGLQEVDCRARLGASRRALDHLAAATGLRAVAGPTMRFPGPRGALAEWYGNALLTRLPVKRSFAMDLSCAGHEPRGALVVDLDGRGRAVRAVVTHLGLRHEERRSQVERLLAGLSAGGAAGGAPGGPLTVILGDLNEWRPDAPSLMRLHEAVGPSAPVATFPALFPLLALDRIAVAPPGGLVAVRAHASRTARLASDHLPVRGTLRSP